MPDLRWFVRQVEEAGDLARIQAEVDWDLELAHVAKLSEERGGPLLLFERIKGYPGRPVVASLFTTVKRMALALGAPDRNSICQLARFWVDRTTQPVPPVSVPPERAPVYENSVTGPEVDVLRFVPVPKLYPMDGGRFIGTAVGVVTQDPETGWVNVGTYRSQVFDGRTLGLQPIKGKDADLHIQNARKRGMRRMPVALVFGSDPLLFLTASTLFGRGVCEYDMVGALRGEPMEVTPGKYTGLPIPADAEYVVEGDLVIAEDELRLEGPFGEYTGYPGVGSFSGRLALKKLALAAESLIRDRHPEGFFLVDERQRIVGWSSGMEEILGLATHQALGRPCFEVLRRLRLRDPLPCSRNCNPLRAAAKGERSVCVLRREHTLGAWSLLHQPVATPNGALVLHRLRDASLEVISIRFLRRVIEALRDGMDELQLAKAAAYADNVALTTREKQVLHLLARGLPTRAIAERLSTSYYTARNYAQSLLSKLDAHNRVEVVVAAQRLGLLDGEEERSPAQPAVPPPGQRRPAR